MTDEWDHLRNVLAVTFRPGDRTATFHDKWLRPAGMAVAVVLTYGDEASAMNVSGYSGRVEADGRLTYGFRDDREFSHRADLTPGLSTYEGRMNVQRNPSLVEMVLRMDRICQQRNDMQRLPTIPGLPRVLLAFAPDEPPEFEVTDALHQLAAVNLGVSLKKLDANPPYLVERLLWDTWHAELVGPDAVGNTTGYWLMDSEYCTQMTKVTRVFEDFRRLLGAPTWNPARVIEVFKLPNPAGQVLARHGIDPANGFDGPIPDGAVEQMAVEMRMAIGSDSIHFADEDLLDGLTQPDRPLAAMTLSLPRLRARLNPYWSECSTDQDLRNAAMEMDQPLWASGACGVQVLRRRAGVNPLVFSGEELNRRMDIDWQPETWSESLRS